MVGDIYAGLGEMDWDGNKEYVWKDSLPFFWGVGGWGQKKLIRVEGARNYLVTSDCDLNKLGVLKHTTFFFVCFQKSFQRQKCLRVRHLVWPMMSTAEAFRGWLWCIDCVSPLKSHANYFSLSKLFFGGGYLEKISKICLLKTKRLWDPTKLYCLFYSTSHWFFR